MKIWTLIIITLLVLPSVLAPDSTSSRPWAGYSQEVDPSMRPPTIVTSTFPLTTHAYEPEFRSNGQINYWRIVNPDNNIVIEYIPIEDEIRLYDLNIERREDYSIADGRNLEHIHTYDIDTISAGSGDQPGYYENVIARTIARGTADDGEPVDGAPAAQPETPAEGADYRSLDIEIQGNLPESVFNQYPGYTWRMGGSGQIVGIKDGEMIVYSGGPMGGTQDVRTVSPAGATDEPPVSPTAPADGEPELGRTWEFIDEDELPEAVQEFIRDKGIQEQWARLDNGQIAAVQPDDTTIIVSADGKRIEVFPEITTTDPAIVFELRDGEFEEVRAEEAPDATQPAEPVSPPTVPDAPADGEAPAEQEAQEPAEPVPQVTTGINLEDAQPTQNYVYDPETGTVSLIPEGETPDADAVIISGSTANMLGENGFVYDEDEKIWYTPQTEEGGVRQQEIFHVGDDGQVERTEQIQVTEDDEGNEIEEQTIVQTFDDEGKPTTTTTTTETGFDELGEPTRTLEVAQDHQAGTTTFEETEDGQTTKYQVQGDGGVAQWDPDEKKWVEIDPAVVPRDLRGKIVDAAVGYNPELSRAGIEWRVFLRWLGATVRGYESYQAGFSQISSLVGMEDEYNERWTEKVNDFCLFGGLSSCFESVICGSLRDLGITNYDVVQDGILTTPGRASAHIEGDRSTGFETEQGTKYYYRVTFGFVNDADQERNVHVEFTGPNSQYSTADETVAAGGSITFINHNALISDSYNYYDKICLVWNPAMDTYGMLQPRRENRICNSLGPAEGYSEAEYEQQESDEAPEEDEGIQLGEGF